ncbi:hypothetical protein K6106_07235 [Pseudomonas fluorescens]|nr:hypothetical protein K6106_07235 [Pseudomonas fluorescens]
MPIRVVHGAGVHRIGHAQLYDISATHPISVSLTEAGQWSGDYYAEEPARLRG